MSANPCKESVIVRLVGPEDEEEWKRLWKLYLVFYKSSLPEEVAELNFKRFLNPEVKMWSALAIDTVTNKPIGMVNYFCHFHTWDVKDKILLNDLYVDENSRVKGVGRKLITHVYEHADKLEISNVYWHTDFFNHRAQLLYTKIGERTTKVQYRRI